MGIFAGKECPVENVVMCCGHTETILKEQLTNDVYLKIKQPLAPVRGFGYEE